MSEPFAALQTSTKDSSHLINSIFQILCMLSGQMRIIKKFHFGKNGQMQSLIGIHIETNTSPNSLDPSLPSSTSRREPQDESWTQTSGSAFINKILVM
jgi:hypothetical protein